jgi:hypothetical protein
MTESAIKKGSFDKLIYVANCESIGTVDDKNHLQFISRYVDNTKIIFALNKLDSFKQSDDSVKESISSFRNELREHGFQNPVICPISAYAAWLAKKSLFGDGLKEDEECDIQHYMRKFQKTEFDFESYYESNNESGHDYQCTETDTEKNKKYIELLRKSGMLSFESIILK